MWQKMKRKIKQEEGPRPIKEVPKMSPNTGCVSCLYKLITRSQLSMLLMCWLGNSRHFNSCIISFLFDQCFLQLQKQTCSLFCFPWTPWKWLCLSVQSPQPRPLYYVKKETCWSLGKKIKIISTHTCQMKIQTYTENIFFAKLLQGKNITGKKVFQINYSSCLKWNQEI